jgi:glycine hydroxymethyltransferase
LAKEKDQTRIVVRFQFQEKGVRMAHPGDPVVDKRGKTTGFVTSCAVDSEGMLTGQAYIEKKNAKKETLLLIYPGASQTRRKTPAELEFGDPINIPNSANVLRRFPKL